MGNGRKWDGMKFMVRFRIFKGNNDGGETEHSYSGAIVLDRQSELPGRICDMYAKISENDPAFDTGIMKKLESELEGALRKIIVTNSYRTALSYGMPDGASAMDVDVRRIS